MTAEAGVYEASPVKRHRSTKAEVGNAAKQGCIMTRAMIDAARALEKRAMKPPFMARRGPGRSSD